MRCSPGIDRVADRQSSVLRRVFRCGLAVVLVVGGMVLGPAALAQQALPWMDATLAPEQRADLLLNAMTLDQKLEQIYNEPVYNDDLDVDGNPDTKDRTRLDCDFTPVGRHIEGDPGARHPRLPAGQWWHRDPRRRLQSQEPITTGLPAQIASAATFDRGLNYQWGQLLDSELRAWAHQVLWGPGMNLIRTPYGGRNQEYFSEDPYLTGALARRDHQGHPGRRREPGDGKALRRE